MMLRPLPGLALAIALASPAFCTAHAQDPQRPTSTPYSGDLSIFEDADRDAKLHTDRVMDELHLHPGSVIADIGAGGGWFSVRAAKRVAPGGKVIAEDINQHAVDTIRDRAAHENLPDIVPVLGTPDDPHLAPGSIDAALMLRVYHEVAHPAAMLAHLHEAMRPGARFAVIDHPGQGDDHGINADVVRREVEAAGFQFTGLYDFPKADQGDYMEVFTKPHVRPGDRVAAP